MHGWDRTGGWLLQAARPCIEDHESPSPPDQPAYPPAGEYVRQAMVEAVQLSFPRASAQGGASARTCGTSVINKPPLIAQPLDRRGHRDSLDLDQKVVADQPPDLHGGACGQSLGVEVLVADLADDWHLRRVDDVVVELHHLLEGGPDCLERRPQVVEHLPCLGADIAWSNKRAGRVESDLSRDVDRPARHDLDYVRVSSRRVHCLGIDEPGRGWDVHGRRTGHATGPFSGVVVGDDEVYGRGGSDRALLTGCALCPEPPFEAVADVERWVLDGPVVDAQVVEFGALEGGAEGHVAGGVGDLGAPDGRLEVRGEGEADAEATGREAHGALEPAAPLVVADGVAVVDPGPLAGVERELGLLVLQQQPSLFERVAVELGFGCHRFVTTPRLETEFLEGQRVL